MYILKDWTIFIVKSLFLDGIKEPVPSKTL